MEELQKILMYDDQTILHRYDSEYDNFEATATSEKVYENTNLDELFNETSALETDNPDDVIDSSLLSIDLDENSLIIRVNPSNSIVPSSAFFV